MRKFLSVKFGRILSVCNFNGHYHLNKLHYHITRVFWPLVDFFLIEKKKINERRKKNRCVKETDELY